MRVYQAIYGEDSTHGHGLLAHSPLSPGEQVPFAEATRRTDLPNTPPGGTNWTPYLRGFSEADYFVLTRTFPDEGASRRGMVITHALFLPLNEFCAVGKLSSAIALLQGDLKSGWKTHDTNLQVLDLSEVAPKTPGSRLGRMVDSNRYHALIHALVEEGVRLPVVWIGQAQFDEALSTLWEFLSPELRRTFTFRISFSPRDVEEAPPLLVCTPESLASHWPPPYKALGISMESLTITSPMAYLMGGESSHALRELQENLNIIVDGFSALRDLARIYTNIEEFRATNKLEPLDASLRLVAERVPLPTHGANMKSRLLMALTDRVPEAGRSEIRALRNFPAEAFPDGRRIIQSALIDWGRDVIFKHRLPTVDVVGVITEALKGNSLWATALQEGVRDALRQIDVHAATALWQWWKADSAMVSQLTSFVPNTPGSEATLVKTCPDSMSASTGGAIAHLARNRNWLRLHAATVAAYLPFRQALEAHLQVDKDPKIVDMVRSLCSKVSGQEVVAAALSLDDSRLIGIAGERIAQDNSLKKSIDVVDVRWRDIWLASIEAGPHRSKEWQILQQFVGQSLTS